MASLKSSKITYEYFARVDIHFGIIFTCRKYNEAKKPSFKIWIDLGPEIGQKKHLLRLPNTILLIGL